MKAALADEDGVLLDNFMHASVEPVMSGSTVAVCLINLTAGELVVSNLGDSHVILAERDPKTEYPYHIVEPCHTAEETKTVTDHPTIASPHRSTQAGSA